MRTNLRIAILLLLAVFMPMVVSAQKKSDWARYGRYADANKEVTVRPKAVLFGDSITDVWPNQDQEFFWDNNFVGRGISGQTTTQILCRMQQDVVALRPKYVVILAGINDIALNDGCAPDIATAIANIKSMCEIAKANKIKPVVCSLLPSYRINWRSSLKDVKEKVAEFNSQLKAYADANKIKYVDYYTAFAGEGDMMPEAYSKDTVHPNLEGYKVMEKCLLEVIK